MINTGQKETYTLKSADMSVSFLPTGDIFEMFNGNIMINQLQGNPIDGAPSNLFLRVYTQDEVEIYPLLGIKSASEVKFSDSQAVWFGKAGTLNYQITFTLTDRNIWFWDIELECSKAVVDIIYGQDIGLATRGMVQSNEAYTSQYVGHSVFETEEGGIAVCSRQNQPQDGLFPYLQLGSFMKLKAFSTDGYQFFGLTYKETDIPEALLKEQLQNKVYQYEFAYIALQSEKIHIAGKENFVFYGIAKDNHEMAITEHEYVQEIKTAFQEKVNQKNFQAVQKQTMKQNIGKPLQVLSMTLEEINQHYPQRCHEELEGDTLLSFFTETHEHIVLKEKENVVERSHGHIILSGQNTTINENILTSTSYMYGLFNTQVTVGNTTMNKLLSNARNGLNVMKASGQRIYVEIDGAYHLLTMPSLYEMGFNYTKWYYKTHNETFIITNYTSASLPEIHLHLQTKSGRAYRFFITNQITINHNEFDASFHIEKNDKLLTITPASTAPVAAVYPNICYHLYLDGTNMTVTDEKKLINGAESLSASLVVLDLECTNQFTLTVQGHINGGDFIKSAENLETEKKKYQAFYQDMLNGFKLSLPQKKSKHLEKLNTLAWWYTHNMFIHYLVPHGLEQYGGAAWGTRDVCQGPVEYFMAAGRFEIVKQILLKVYTHQFKDDGNWPQWFMFDKYETIQAGESHGDVIVWPLKVLGDYLSATEDYSILEEEIPYTDRQTLRKISSASLLEHVDKQITYIKDHFLHDTFLSAYGDGDWDDTLQPANSQLKKYMVSSWTVALTYQTLKQYAQVLRNYDESLADAVQLLVGGIEKDFKRFILNSPEIPGFLYLEDVRKADRLIHPQDSKTGIQYRLLPMTRSIIAELFTKEQAEEHTSIIFNHLLHPDGVRLMNKPAPYTGGVSVQFKRAEQAANFGREIGLQYVHAHIRFIEAMAKLGKAEEAWHALAVINPINIKSVVPNAERRQSNAYFSSSDGKFSNRYEAAERFNELQAGNVAVKGGWRIYSSGPGIYMHQLISNCLGIRQLPKYLVLDPVLSKDLDGLRFEFVIYGKAVTFIFKQTNGEKKITVNNQELAAETAKNRYRDGAFLLPKAQLLNYLQAGMNVIVVQH